MQPPAVPHVHGCCHISSLDYLFLCPLHWNFLRETRTCSHTPASVQWITKACQRFGAQRDVASCRKRESREKAKQDIFRCVRGAAPALLSALGGKRSRGSGLAVLLSPLLCPGPALLSVGHVLLYNTPFSPHDIESNCISIHAPRELLNSWNCTLWNFYFSLHTIYTNIIILHYIIIITLLVYYKKQDENRKKM